MWTGGLGEVRVLMTIEEHGAGRQLVRFRAWPHCSRGWLALTAGLALLAAAAAADGAWVVSASLGAEAFLPALRMGLDCGAASRMLRKAVEPTADTSPVRQVRVKEEDTSVEEAA